MGSGSVGSFGAKTIVKRLAPSRVGTIASVRTSLAAAGACGRATFVGPTARHSPAARTTSPVIRRMGASGKGGERDDSHCSDGRRTVNGRDAAGRRADE